MKAPRRGEEDEKGSPVFARASFGYLDGSLRGRANGPPLPGNIAGIPACIVPPTFSRTIPRVAGSGHFAQS